MEAARTESPQPGEPGEQPPRADAPDGQVRASGARSIGIGGDVNHSQFITGDNVTVTIYQGAQITVPSPAAVQRHQVELRHRLEQEAKKRWGGMGAYIEEQGAHLPIEASPYQTGLTGPRGDLLRTMRRAKRLLVLGEPGSGKTVALQRLAWELCGDPEPVIPVIVPLLFYAGAELSKWVRDSLQETGHLRLEDERTLAAFLHEETTQCCFLFDGLNEVGPQYRDQLVQELVLWTKAYPRHSLIVTSRAQDELWRKLRQAMDETVVIQPITEPQIAQYLQDQLGEERGRALFGRMDDRLRTLAQRPLLLWLMKEAGAASESLPGNRGELYARFVSRLLSRDTQERQLGIDIKDQAKRQAAAHLAYGLHQSHTLVCSREQAVEIVAASLPGTAEAADAAVTSLARHGILIGDQHVRFPHQTLQEHFTAVALQEQVKRQQQLAGIRRLVWEFHRALGGSDGLSPGRR